MDSPVKERFTFDSWTDYANYAERAAVDPSMTPNLKKGGYRGGLNIRPDFQGVESYDEAISLARYGWKDGVAKAMRLSDRLESRLTGYIQRDSISYDVTGELLDVARYAAGYPEHWGVWQSEIVESPGVKFLHVVVNGTASAKVDKTVLIRRGATLASLVNLMELAHYRVRVTLSYRLCGGGNGVCAIDVAVKDFDDRIDIDKLTYALAHPAAFRCLAFTTLDTIKDPGLYESIPGNHSYGTPEDVPMSERGDVYLPRMYVGEPEWGSEGSCERWLISELKRQHVLAKDFATA